MIKLFGQIRYHWQPELSWAIMYWSLATMPFFIALSLLYEKTKNPQLVFFLVLVSLLMTILGFQRYFIIGDQDLRMHSFVPTGRAIIPIASIEKIEVSKYRVCFHLSNQRQRTVFMRKWVKKFFLDAMGVHPEFRGEVELVDNLHRVDYFKTYRKNKKPLVKD